MFTIKTEFPCCVGPDFDFPNPVANAVNTKFNAILYEIKPGRQLKILELGCGGGGAVESFIDDGHLAIGLEGADVQPKNKLHSWATIPDNLFMADITKPFAIQEDGNNVWFDFILAFEVMEHLAEDEIDGLCDNLNRYLDVDGMFICSISTREHPPGHRTIKPREWWEERFLAHGLKSHPEYDEVFHGEYIRMESDSFNLHLKRD